MGDLLGAGVGFVDEARGTRDFAAVASDLADQCLRVVDHRRLPVRGLLLLASADWCTPGDSVSVHIRRTFAERVGYSVPLLGSSMARLYCSTAPSRTIDHGMVLLALCSNDFWMTVDRLPEPHRLSEGQRKQRLREMVGRLELQGRPRLGTSAQRDLLGFLPGIFLDSNGQQAYFDNELHWEILQAFSYRYRLFGGAAADAVVPTTGYQFADDDCLESGLALAIIESDVGAGAATGHGFSPVKDVSLSVDQLVGDADSGYDIALLDGKPAAQRLQELRKQIPAASSQMVLGLPCKPDFDVVVPINLPLNGEPRPDGTVRLSRRIARGEHLYLLHAAPKDMIREAETLFRSVRDNASARTPNEVAFILAISCTGRHEAYQKGNAPWQQAVERIRQDYAGIPLVGGLCAGEFGVDAWRRSRTNNMSISVCCLTNVLCLRARNRHLQDLLLQGADAVSVCASPRDVMEEALRAAVSAGATGGQICIVDRLTGRIVGGASGCAYQGPGSPHNWTAACKCTDRSAVPNDDTVSCALPEALQGWAASLRPATACATTLPASEDLLTLIVRCGVALFVPNSRDPLFRCNPEAVKECVADAGGPLVQLAMPLVGSDGAAIATLQVGFPDDTVLDRESMRLWVSYAQRVAAALELAQETEERRIRDAISAAANRILQEPINTRIRRRKWFADVFQPYVTAVRKAMGASGTHMRIRCEGLKGDEYILVAGDGRLDELRRCTRPVIGPHVGSLSRDPLGKAGKIVNRREDLLELNADVEPLEGDEQTREAFRKELSKLESTARLLLYQGDYLLGAFVIDSQQRYFFTERWARIARFAAETAGNALRERQMAYDRALLEAERQRSIDLLAATTGFKADESFRKILENLCEATGADVGSVYLWHEEAGRIVLHAAHNWDCGRLMEGKACYKLGEGWTGLLAQRLDPKDCVWVVDPGLTNARTCSRKYYAKMVPLEQRVPPGQAEARVGICLAAGKELVGVVVLTYWRSHSGDLVEDRQRIQDLAMHLAPLLTLAARLARGEILRRQFKRLMEAEQAAVEKIIEAARPVPEWQEVLEVLRDRFLARTVTFYELEGKQLHHRGTATAAAEDRDPPPASPLDPMGPMMEAVASKREVVVGPANPHALDQWPPLKGARGALLVPVLSALGDVLGVLEFIDHARDREHPFDGFDEYERETICDVARAAGAAIEHRTHELETVALRKQLADAIKVGAASITAAIVMHQIMAPFGRIQQALEWLRRHQQALDTDCTARLDRIQKACADAVGTITEAAGRGAIAMRRVSLRALVAQALRVVEADGLAPGVRLDLSNAVDAPLHVNVVPLVGALVNLLSNAVEAIEPPGTLTVATSVSPDRQRAIICIRNTGKPLTPSQVQRFFLPGYTSKGDESHLGLGLSIARQTVKMADGELDMRPCPEGGVEAIVTLPLADAQDQQSSRAKGDNR